jgi:hypothetical protein
MLMRIFLKGGYSAIELHQLCTNWDLYVTWDELVTFEPKVPGAGIEPTLPRSERGVLPLNRTPECQRTSTGRRIRTFTTGFKAQWPTVSPSPCLS